MGIGGSAWNPDGMSHPIWTSYPMVKEDGVDIGHCGYSGIFHAAPGRRDGTVQHLPSLPVLLCEQLTWSLIP